MFVLKPARDQQIGHARRSFDLTSTYFDFAQYKSLSRQLSYRAIARATETGVRTAIRVFRVIRVIRVPNRMLNWDTNDMELRLDFDLLRLTSTYFDFAQYKSLSTSRSAASSVAVIKANGNYRNPALISSSAFDPGHNTFSFRVFSGSAAVFSTSCKFCKLSSM